LLQSEKFDLEGEYLRKWVLELKGIQGKAIHKPYDRAKNEAEKAGYPKRIVDHKASQDRALARYKEDWDERRRDYLKNELIVRFNLVFKHTEAIISSH
jgi:hypothetical protein